MSSNDPPLLLNLADSDKDDKAKTGSEEIINTEEEKEGAEAKPKGKKGKGKQKTTKEKLESKLLPVTEEPTLKELRKKVGLR